MDWKVSYKKPGEKRGWSQKADGQFTYTMGKASRQDTSRCKKVSWEQNTLPSLGKPGHLQEVGTVSAERHGHLLLSVSNFKTNTTSSRHKKGKLSIHLRAINLWVKILRTRKQANSDLPQQEKKTVPGVKLHPLFKYKSELNTFSDICKSSVCISHGLMP